MKLKEFILKNRETLQLIYGMVLIVLIPILIAYNTIFIINKYNAGLDAALQRQALVAGRSIYSLLKDDLHNTETLQKKIETVLEKNIDFKELSILIPENDDFKVIASSKKENTDKIFKSYYYKLAWMQPDNDGLATDSLRLSSSSEDEQLVQNIPEQKRFWLVAMPMSDINGKKQYLLSMRISSEIIDSLTNYNRNASIFLLVLTILIVILFLSIAIRLWDYAILYKKIKEVDKMKDEFISMASHELRTPITAIRGYISMMLDGSYGKLNKKLTNPLNIIQGSSERLADLIEDLLNVSRIEQGRLKIENKDTDINPIIKNTIEELKVQSEEKKLKLIYKPHTQKLPLLHIDSERFKQVLINLIGNGIKYTEKGSIEILTEEKNQGKILELKIKDTGIGMSAKARERLFEKFYRVQNEKTQKITGTGLGLWITKQIIELMNGTIMVDSIENVGTQVTLMFPIIKK